MSKSNTARRVALLASSALGLAAIASVGAVLAPAKALAQTATCTATTAVTGNGTSAVTIAGGTNNPGISCIYTGDTATVTTLGAITVSSTAPANIPLNGVNLTATGTSDINWTSTAGTVTGSTQTNGPVIEALTEQGDITLSTGAVTGSSATVTDGIRAVSSGGGRVSVTTTGAVSGTNATTGDAGIEAVSTGGNGNVSITAGNSISGRLYGIQARSSGTGTLSIAVNSGSVSAGNAASIAAIDAVTGAGLFTLNAGAVSTSTSTGIDAHALRLVSGGNAVINVASLSGRGLTRGVLDLTTSSGTLTTVTATGRIGIGAIQTSLNPYATLAIAGRGGGAIQINTSDIRGQVDFSALTGNATVGVTGGWDTQATSRFGSGNDTVSIGPAGVLALYSSSINPAPNTTMIFGGGTDTFNNAGVIVFDRSGQTTPITLSFEGLEAFNNSGLIRMGNLVSSPGVPMGILETDRARLSVLMAPGATFTGSGDSLVLMDVSYGTAGQASCDPALRDATTSVMPSADCIGLQGGATAGVTKLLVFDIVPGDRGFNNEIVLVDVAGGTSAAGHFVLDERSDGYTADNGGMIDKGFYLYPLVFDPDTQQHKLVSVAGQNALQFPLLAGAVQGLWRTSTGTWFDRQADIRGGLDEGIGGGVWLRASGENAERTAVQTIEAAGNTFVFDNSFEQKSYAVTGGVDLISASSQDTAFVAGFMAGYAHSDMGYEASPNIGRLDGWSAGLYGSYLAGGLFVDAAVNANKLVLDNDVPGLNLFPSGTILSTDLVSVGALVEAGWRFPVMVGAFIEPLAAISYVRSTIEDFDIPSDDPARERIFVVYDDPTSLRGSLGGRLGLDQDYGVVRAQYSLLGRVWNELEDGNAVIFQGPGDDAFAADEFTGQVSEIGVGASIYGADGLVSGFLNLGGKFGDDYEARTASVGVRAAW